MIRILASMAWGILAALLLPALAVWADEVVRLPGDPDLAPDGKRLVFAWRGDLWTVPSGGGVIRRLTTSPARESQPKFSPDGKSIAFISDRTGAGQLFVMPAAGGEATQLTFHSEGCGLEQWTADGEQLLITAQRDHFWRHAERFFLVPRQPRGGEQLVVDAYGSHGRLSADGQRLLLMREGERWWRKGYRGSRAGQIWLFDRRSSEFQQVVAPVEEARWPLWHPARPDTLFYVGGQSGSFNLWQRDLSSGQERQLTEFTDDSVVMPCISADGKWIVFRHQFDFYRYALDQPRPPVKLRLVYRGDRMQEPVQRRTLDKATDVAFTADGLELAFIAGGDVWVMDTVLREPRQVTNTPEEERDPAFSPDGNQLVFASDRGGQSDLWRAERGDPKKFWWQNESFPLTQWTNDPEWEGQPRWSPDGQQLAFLKQRGDLWLIRSDGTAARRLLESWNKPDYAWSPDGQWLAYAVSDNDFNRDVFLLPLDGSRPAFNLSRHPDNDGDPVWSPDGSLLAFVGRRLGDETDLYFVHLRKSADDLGPRGRKLREAVQKITKVRQGSPGRPAPGTPPSPESPAGEQPRPVGEQPPGNGSAAPPKLPRVEIDFEGIDERIRRVSIEQVAESSPFWSPDSKQLAFTATIGGKAGTYTVSPPDELSPKLLSATTGQASRWIAQGNQILWLAAGVPGSLTAQGQATAWPFRVRQQVELSARHAAVFDLCWRQMRDNFYDELLNHRNWDAIRRKYRPLAEGAAESETLTTVVQMMLGELNGSHLGFTASRPDERGGSWTETTAHLGARFDPTFAGPGLRIALVLRGGPADQEQSRLRAGEVILRINDTPLDPALDLTSVLNGPLERDLRLRVRADDGQERDVALRPISYGAARELLYEHWVRSNQAQVEQASGGKFGYVHIRGMNMPSFYRFERELYSVAAGKSGLVIDVRENGGGSTTDHLLTVLTQPVHAITVPRGGGPGYPHDRRVYATWHQPIVVLCNQNSFSNAEIFSHAIQTLGRGQVVGVPTAGGVISTGSAPIMDAGTLRMPFRGWFVAGTGEDMELHGAVPDHIVWPAPGELPAGVDRQLTKALEVLRADVEAASQRARPPLIKASQR